MGMVIVLQVAFFEQSYSSPVALTGEQTTNRADCELEPDPCESPSISPVHQPPSSSFPMQGPEGLPSQLVKCVMKREYDSTRPKAVKYTLRLGDRIGQSTFMMTALQVSR